MNIFRGFVPTKDKKCQMAFKNKAAKDLLTYEQVKLLPEFAGILADETILIDIDEAEPSDILFQIVQDYDLQCRVYKTTRGKHFLFKNFGVETNRTKCKLACCITSDIKLGCKNSYSILKYNGVEREIIYDSGEYQDVPKWLTPVKTSMEFLEMDAGDGRNQAFFNYILTLQSNDFTVEEARECIRIINKYVLKVPLSETEIETILRDDAFQKPIFFKGSAFLFDKFATYLKNNHHVIKINGQLHLYRDGIYINGLEKIEAEMIKHIPNLNRSKRMEVLSYLTIAIDGDCEKQPSAANYIAFKNGVYNIVDDSFTDFTHEHIITNRIDWNYNPAAYSEIADRTLNKLACQDPQIRMLLEEVIGYCLYRRNELGKAFIMIGDKSNGKSTFLDMVRTLLGENNISSLDLKELGDRFSTVMMLSKLANIGDDIEDEWMPNASTFKKIVTGDRLTCEQKGLPKFEFNPYCKLLFSANNIPRIKDKTGAVLRRLIIIPFDAKFSSTDPDFDPYVKYKLREAEPIEYLINIAIKGLKRVLENRKFSTSEKVEKEIQEYDAMNNPIIGFVQEIGIDAIENEPTKHTYRQYQEYCISNSLQPLSNIQFSRDFCNKFDFESKQRKIDGKNYRIFVKRVADGA